ncbi:DNA recombination protein RmuC [Millisia brevis]|uniref:DNA recombination protein RmuC n=1 Tax=Millisia brevis TaxID=264148 RepID=UPI00082D2050|nr:DNA recombination protein RmuC [Millisia brevis]
MTVSLPVLLVAVLLGVAAGWVLASWRAAAGREVLRDRLTAALEREAVAARRGVAAEADGADTGRRIAEMVDPLRAAVDTLSDEVRRIERSRIDAYSGLREQIAGFHRVSVELSSQTGRLAGALRSPGVRGRWGELQLERVVELAGLARHCDFDTQVSGDGIRPDMVVRLPGDRHLVVDAKVPLDGYLDAAATDDAEAAGLHRRRHARALRTHVDRLAEKRYWDAFGGPEFVVLFVPGDPILDAALADDSRLLEHAFERSVILATPTSLIALLRTVAHTWRQDSIARDAVTIRDLGRDLHERIGAVAGRMTRLGTQLTGAVGSYNAALTALDSEVFGIARRLRDAQVVGSDIAEVRPIRVQPLVTADPQTPDAAPEPPRASAST